ncbi:MAG: hypothetical protein KAS71_19215 [Bacteroidales bacterium]|nr:hypothetical protein [Bacteroidales bacterium]
MKRLICILFVFVSISAKAQNEKNLLIELGTEIPLNYSIGLVSNFSEHLQFSFRTGVLTKPYDLLILEIIELTGTKESLVNTIRDAFTYGLTAKGGINYTFPEFYTGIYYSYGQIHATDVPVDILNNYFEFNLPPNFFDPIEYTLESTLHNIGIMIGKTFPLSENISLATEFSMIKAIKTKNSISCIYDDEMILASNIIHDKLDPLYKKFAYLPSINVFVRFNL